jgi:hypothetical protein
MSERFIEVNGHKLYHIRESALRLSNNDYKLLNENEIPAELKESRAYKANVGKHFTESETTGALKAAIKLREGTTNLQERAVFDNVIKKLREEGISSERKLWKFPVSRFGNVNGNGRIYTEQLWRNVINNQRDTWQGGCGLADHPMDDADPGQFKTSAIVWLDMIIDTANKLIWAIGTFVGEYGRLAQEIIEAGGRVGFSSSGFGETLSDGKTVDPDTYIIERVADIVTNPSQSVFGDISSEQSYNPGNVEYTKQTRESVEISPKSKIIEGKEKHMKVDAVNMDESKNATPETKLEEGKTANVGPATLSKLERKVIEKQVEAMLNETDNSTNPMEKLTEVNELLKLVKESNDEELINKVQEKLEKTHAELTTLVESAANAKKEFGDLNEMVENTKKNLQIGVLLNEQVADYKELCEGLTTRNRELAKQNAILESKLALKENHIAKTEETVKNEKMVEEKTVADLKAKLEEATSKLAEADMKVAALTKGNKKMESENGVLRTRLNHVMSNLKIANESLAKMDKENKALLESKNTYRQKVIRLQQTIKENEATLADEKQKFEEYKQMNKPKLNFEPAHIDSVSKYLNIRESKGLAVENYWNDLVSQYGEAVKPFERQIRGAKTYREAFDAFLKYLPRIDESAGQAEAASWDEGVGTYRERQQNLEDAGMEKMTENIDEINAIELENMRKMGLM